MSDDSLDFTYFDNAPDNRKKSIGDSFQALARAQRGRPESLGTSPRANPNLFNATGAFTYLAEHLGDLTHRMSEWGGDRTDFGYSTVGEKVRRAMRYWTNGYGVEKEVLGNLRNNWGVECERENPRTFEKFVEDWQEAANQYAAAYSELPVYNRAQYHCRETAVALGERNWRIVGAHLTVISSKLLQGLDDWRAWAGEAYFQGEYGPLKWEDALEIKQGLEGDDKEHITFKP